MTASSSLTLVVLAAGMGSRYGGLKQLDPVGPSGQTMLDYGVEDAIRAGFARVVFVIRRDFEAAFREQFGQRYAGRLEVAYAFQSLEYLPGVHTVPEGRTKPWGTAQAVLATRSLVKEPFAVINADDFYGRQAYETMATHLCGQDPNRLGISMIGYPLQNTLSPHGAVNRGICQLNTDQTLAGVQEFTHIAEEADGIVRGEAMNGERRELDPQSLVSMNFWGFTPALFDYLEPYFDAFLKEHGKELKSECYLPAVVDALINEQGVRCPVLQADSPWFGVTYPDDKPRVVACIRSLTRAGLYRA